MKLITQVYRSTRKEGAYLYVEKGKDMDELPAELMTQLGKIESSMILLLTPDKKLARADAKKVISEIQEKGFYLQMPPAEEAYMKQIPNSKMTDKPVY